MKAVVESYEGFWYSQFASEMQSAFGELEERIKVYEIYDQILVALDPGGTFNTVVLAKEALKCWMEDLRGKTWPKMIVQCVKGEEAYSSDPDVAKLLHWLSTHVVAGYKYEDLYTLEELVEDTPSTLGLSSMSYDGIGKCILHLFFCFFN